MGIPISLVVTTYNRERYLSTAIESILAQTRCDFELLIWDDGSTDNSLDIACNYAKCDRRIRVIAAQHQGQALSLKAAIAQTRGTYIGWVDSDDLLDSKALAETAIVLDTHPDVGLVYTDYVVIDERNKVTGDGRRCRIPYSKERLLHNFMTFHFRLIRRSVFDQVGGIDASFAYAEDYDLCLRLSEVTEVRHVKKPLYYYRDHLENISHQQRVEQIYDSRKAMMRALKRRRVTKHSRANLPRWSQLSFQLSSLKLTARISPLVVALPLTGAINLKLVQAQSIVPAADGTNTIVTPDGSRFDISGGQLSSDRANLFHSFTQFGLSQNQIANFLSNPDIRNILARVVGGDASLINGLIQVSGGNSNLFLMNPAGIVFGANASLNLPAAFTATTATGIGIDSNWFKATGANNYAALVGTPSTFAFTTTQPGGIVNAGNLSVSQGQNLSLVGGTVISTGQLSAPKGAIAVAAVPGENMVRISQEGHLLSLDIQPIAPNSNQLDSGLPPAISLPELLTGGGADNATQVTLNSNGVVLSGSGLKVADGDVVAREVTAQTATLSANHNLTLVPGAQLRTDGDLNLLAQDTVRARESATSPFLAQTGGNLYRTHLTSYRS